MAKRYVLVLLIAGILYSLSAAPGPVWQDGGLIQYRVWHNDLEGLEGLALAHPLYHILAMGAKHIPVGEFGHRVNLVSAFAAAFAVANLYLLMRLWLGRDFPAVIAAATLAVSHTFWWHASVTEIYTLWAALFLGEMILLLEYTTTKKVRYLYGLGLLNGLAVAVHMLATIPFVCYLVFLLVLGVRRTIRAKDLALIAALWILGALPYEYLILKNMIHSGDILGTLASAAFGSRWRADVLNMNLSWKLLREDLLFLVLNFPTPNALLFFVGLASLRKIAGPPGFRGVLAALLVLFFLFACRYTVADRFAFFLPFYCLVAVVIGVGAGCLPLRTHGGWQRQAESSEPADGLETHCASPRQAALAAATHASRSDAGAQCMPQRGPSGGIGLAMLVVAFAVLPMGVYALMPKLAERAHLPLGTRQDIPFRDDYEYFLRPWRTGDRGAERFARAAMETAEPNALVCADSTTVAPLLYLQEVKGVRPDVKIVSGVVCSQNAPQVDEQNIGALLGEHPVYVVSRHPGYCPAFLLARYKLTEAGVLWRVLRTP